MKSGEAVAPFASGLSVLCCLLCCSHLASDRSSAAVAYSRVNDRKFFVVAFALLCLVAVEANGKM